MLLDGYGFERFGISLVVAEQRVEAAAVRKRSGCDYRVGEHQCVRTYRVRIIAVCREHVVTGGSRKIGGEVATGGKADDGDSIAVDMPFGGVRTHASHRFCGFQQRDGEYGRFDGIP